MFITKLKNTSLFKILINNYLYVAFSIIILIIVLTNLYLAALYFIYLYFIYKKEKELLKAVFVIDILIFVIYFIYKLTIKDLGLDFFEGIVCSIERGENKNKIEVTNYFKRIIAYDKSFTNLKIGDKVVISGQNIALSKNHNEYAFNYQRYLLSKKTVSIINIESIDVKKALISIL